mgnify:CR=1 FL=1
MMLIQHWVQIWLAVQHSAKELQADWLNINISYLLDPIVFLSSAALQSNSELYSPQLILLEAQF